jgi:hypothetical protein
LIIPLLTLRPLISFPASRRCRLSDHVFVELTKDMVAEATTPAKGKTR